MGAPLSPLVARQLARRRASRPRHAPGTAGRPPSGVGTVAVVGAVLLVGALFAVVVALWPRGSQPSDELVATDVPTTEERFPDASDETATTDRGDRSSTTDAEGAPATTGPTPATGDTSSTTSGPGSESGPGDADGSGTTSTSAEAGSGGSGGGSTSTTGETTTSSAPPTSGASAPSTSASTTPPPAASPATGDPASAATWHELAECETGGDWSDRSGDDRYGGLRIHEEDWEDHGGEGLPSEHSRETQITIARRIQADEGWDYWRRCARRLGYL